MDKKLLKAYIKVLVEEEVQRILPKLLAEAVSEVKAAKPMVESTTPTPKPKLDRGRLAELMGLDYDRENGTLRAGVPVHEFSSEAGPGMVMGVDSQGNKIPIPANKVAPEALEAITKDYSEIMKRMKLS